MPHYYMFHKPFGCVTARRDDRYPTVMDYFEELHNDRLSPVGRLDRETTGLLLITDDGIFNQKLTHPSYHKEKTYEFTPSRQSDTGTGTQAGNRCHSERRRYPDRPG
mgnify:CR=1 FL=1